MSVWLSPRLLAAHLLAIVCVGIAAGFGVWQYDAWQERRDAQQVDLTLAEPIELAAVMGPDDPFPGDRAGQPVRISGTWLTDSTVLIADRETGGGEIGRWVVTPLTSGGPDAPAVPVVRGWIPEGQGPPAPPTGRAEIVGWLQPPEGTGALDEDPSDDVLPQLRIADLVQRTPGDLYGAYVVLDDTRSAERGGTNAGGTGMAEATLDQLPEVDRFTALRNLLYSVEWFVFAAFAAFVWWRYVRDERDADTDAAAQPVDG